MRNRKNKNVMILSLTILLVFMGIGFAVFNTTLNLKSTSNVSGIWDIRIESITVSEENGEAKSKSIVIDDDKLGATVKNSFIKPGDSVKYSVTVKNYGNINAYIYAEFPSKHNSEYIIPTSTLESGTLLNSLGEATFDIIFTFDINATVLPEGVITNNINIIATQDDNYSSDPAVSESYPLDLTNSSDTYNTIGAEVSIGTELFNIISYDDSSVTLLAKYNLLVGNIVYDSQSVCEDAGYIWDDTGCLTNGQIQSTDPEYMMQSSKALGYYEDGDVFYGIVNFNDKVYWVDDSGNILSKYDQNGGSTFSAYIYDENASIKKYLDDYKNELLQRYGVQSKIRLLSLPEINDIKNSSATWYNKTSYWLGTSQSKSSVMNVSYFKNLYSSSYPESLTKFGVRPVITVKKVYFNN